MDYILCGICDHPSINYTRCVDCAVALGECECDLGDRLPPGKHGAPNWRCVACKEDATVAT